MYFKTLFCLSLQADADVDVFLGETHSFDEYAKEITKYKKLVDEVTYNLDKVLHFHLSLEREINTLFYDLQYHIY